MSENMDKLRALVRRMLTPSVLAVEDDPSDAFFLKEIFKNIHAKLTIATTAQEGERLASQHAYDICFLDLKLPDSQNPVELVDRMKQANPMMPIAILTGSLHDPKLKSVLDQKVVSVLLKPLTREQLLDVFDP